MSGSTKALDGRAAQRGGITTRKGMAVDRQNPHASRSTLRVSPGSDFRAAAQPVSQAEVSFTPPSKSKKRQQASMYLSLGSGSRLNRKERGRQAFALIPLEWAGLRRALSASATVPAGADQRKLAFPLYSWKSIVNGRTHAAKMRGLSMKLTAKAPAMAPNKYPNHARANMALSRFTCLPGEGHIQDTSSSPIFWRFPVINT